MEGFSQRGLVDSALVNKYATFRGVKATRANFDKSIKKCDVECLYPRDGLQRVVESECLDFLRPALTARVLNRQDSIYIDTTTSPGSEWKSLGCKTKGEALRHPLFFQNLKIILHLLSVMLTLSMRLSLRRA